ncbi:hypothetical protein C8R45DRAFT_938054 [Mycena sanguinolenta]|nr:hypothetical protein C8R45DRAFT_938054 [Mycena sanguinolenta]
MCWALRYVSAFLKLDSFDGLVFNSPGAPVSRMPRRVVLKILDLIVPVGAGLRRYLSVQHNIYISESEDLLSPFNSPILPERARKNATGNIHQGKPGLPFPVKFMPIGNNRVFGSIPNLSRCAELLSALYYTGSAPRHTNKGEYSLKGGDTAKTATHKQTDKLDTAQVMPIGLTMPPKITQKRSPAPSPRPSQTTTPVSFNRQRSSPGATAKAGSAPRHTDNREDFLKGDAAKTDKLDTAQSIPVGPSYGSSTINLADHFKGFKSIKEKLAHDPGINTDAAGYSHGQPAISCLHPCSADSIWVS